MSITLLCLVKGNTTANAFPVHIEGSSLVGDLKEVIKEKNAQTFANVDAKDLKLWKVTIPDDHDDLLSNLTLNDGDELLATKKISKYFPDSPLEEHIHVIVKLPLLSLEEVLSCIPPPAYYPSDTSTSISSTNVGGVWPTRIARWKEFLPEVDQYNFDEIQRFERPRFDKNVRIVVETNVYTAIETNMFGILNEALEKYCFSKQKDSDFPRNDPTIGLFVPDYTCRLINNGIYGKPILAFEIKRDIVLQNFKRFTDSDLERFGRQEFLMGHLYDIIGQIYNYMSSLQLQYGILSSYDNHWFLYRPKNNNTELHISHPLARDSTSPPVLKSYAYLAWIADQDPTSPSHNITNSSRRQALALQQNQQNSGSGQISQISGSLSNSRHNLGSTSGGQESNENQDPTEEVFDCSEFKFECSLGYGQTGGTYQCKFYGQTLALKALDLYKNGRYFYQMQKEIEIYKRLSKIQGKYIPKLVCYGYYGGGMGYVMGMTIVGTMLSFHKIEKWQKKQALGALKIIHSNNILHNDIRKENILVNGEGNIFLLTSGSQL